MCVDALSLARLLQISFGTNIPNVCMFQVICKHKNIYYLVLKIKDFSFHMISTRHVAAMVLLKNK